VLRWRPSGPGGWFQSRLSNKTNLKLLEVVRYYIIDLSGGLRATSNESGGKLASREAHWQTSFKVGRSQQSEQLAGITLLAVIAKLLELLGALKSAAHWHDVTIDVTHAGDWART
jgi:hypothetical protein